jgi:site-specific recombinase XerD
MTAKSVSSESFFAHVDSFVDYRKTVYESSDETIRSNLADIRLFEQFMSDTHYASITGEAVMKYQMYLKLDRLNAGSSINRKLFSLRSYGHYLRVAEVEGAGMLPFSDVLKIRTGYGNGPQAFTKTQVMSFFEQIDSETYLGIRDYCVYALMYSLGLRAGEVYRLELKSIDFEAKKLTVTGKGRKRRNLHLTDEMAGIIDDWLSVRSYFAHSDTVTHLFVSKKGNPLAIRTMEDNFKKVLVKSKITVYFNATCHTMRHSFTSHLNYKDVDILILQRLLGHSTPRSTQIYIHPSEERLRAALEKLPAVQYVTRLIETGAIRFQNRYDKQSRITIKRKMAIKRE